MGGGLKRSVILMTNNENYNDDMDDDKDNFSTSNDTNNDVNNEKEIIIL